MIPEVSSDANGTWLDFREHEISAAGIQIAPNSDLATPFNFFWWGVTSSGQILNFFFYLVMSELGRNGREPTDNSKDFVRIIQYSLEDKKIQKFSWGELIGNHNMDDYISEDIVSIRLEYHLPNEPDSVETYGNIVAWARLDATLNVSDPDEVENIGLFITSDLFHAERARIEDFFYTTSLRPLRPSTFQNMVSHIDAALPR